MTLIIRTCEEAEASLSHGAILCTKEQLDEYYLMHYRTRGSKNGERRYQDEHGRLTPEGYRHYAEMYGWNKRLNKISRLQDKADRLINKAAKADVKAAKAKVKSDKAERDANAITRRAILNPGQGRNSEIDNAVLDVARMANLKYQSKQNKADSLHVKIDRANNTAIRLADKLEKKEDRILDKIDKKLDKSQLENAKKFAAELAKRGLADKAIMNTVSNMDAGRTKISQDSDLAIRDSITGLGHIVKEDLENHSYIASVNVGKGVEAQVEIKRNGKDVDITAYAEEGLIKRGLAGKAVEKVKFAINGHDKYVRAQEESDSAEKKVNKLRDEFDSLPEGSQDRIDTLDQVNSYINSLYSGRLSADSKAQEDLERWFANKKTEENESMHNLYNRLDEYDKMSDSEKSKVGSRVLDEIAAQTKDYRTEDDSYAWDTDALQNWLIEKVYEKSGSINAGDYKPGTNAAKAQEKADDTYKKRYDREKQIAAKNGIENLSDVKNQERLEKLLKKDSTWKNLDVQWTKDNNEVMGAILKDLGFPDTPRYRSILYAYGWWD